MIIRYARQADVAMIAEWDCHISRKMLEAAVVDKRILVVATDQIIGWLRFSYFWNAIPFMDMLAVVEAERGKGAGSLLLNYFETWAQEAGHQSVMTSTAANETAQQLYYKRGYQAVGGFYPTGEPYELILRKEFS